MPLDLVLVAQLAIGLVFLRAGIGKLAHPRAFLLALEQYDIGPRWLIYLAAMAILVLEIVIAFTHLRGLALGVAAPAAILLLSTMTIVVVIVLRRHTVATCLCFGANNGEQLSAYTVLRLGVLIVGEFVVLLGTRSETRLLVPLELPPGDLALALLCAALAILIFGWTSSVPVLARTLRMCSACARSRALASDTTSYS